MEAFAHIESNHMLGLKNVMVKSQFKVNPTREMLLSHCTKLTERHLDPYDNGGSVKNYFLRLDDVAGWEPKCGETYFIRISVKGRFVKSIYPAQPRPHKLKILMQRGVA